MQSFNVVAMAVLLTLVVIKGADLIADGVINPKMLAKNVYVVEGAERSNEPQSDDGPKFDPVTPHLTSARIDEGMKIAKQCLQCHMLQKGAGRAGKIGPNLWNVVNSAIGSQADMDYSNALLSKKGLTWTDENLNHYLWKPRDFAKGTKMSFAGLKKVEQRAAIIAYLRSLSDNPPPLPSPTP